MRTPSECSGVRIRDLRVTSRRAKRGARTRLSAAASLSVFAAVDDVSLSALCFSPSSARDLALLQAVPNADSSRREHQRARVVTADQWGIPEPLPPREARRANTPQRGRFFKCLRRR